MEFLKRTKPTLKDRIYNARYRAKIFTGVGKLGISQGPFRMLSELRRLPWMGHILNAYELVDLMTCTRSGYYRQANGFAIGEIITGLLELVEGIYTSPERLILHEDLIPPEIIEGMGLTAWMAELLGMVIPLIDRNFSEYYIDVAENAGIPPDVCSLPKATMGLALEDELPHPIAVVTSNMPCDGGMSSYTMIERKLNVPTFRLDIPYNFYNERAIDYFVGELKRLIAWLQEHTPGRMDWDRLREICEERNRAVEYELELWDLLRIKPAPLAGEPIYLGHMFHMVARPGSRRATRYFKKMTEVASKAIKDGAGAVPDERYRVVLWNPPTLIFPELLVWAEQAYGVATLIDMISYNRQLFIDTSTPESMLRGLSKIIMEGPMARHTRGPADNFFSDLFYLYEYFNLDMIWMAGHIGCKNTQALNGMFREKCREREIPLLIIDYDLLDTRIVSPENIKNQVVQFMETVMNAERLDRD